MKCIDKEEQKIFESYDRGEWKSIKNLDILKAIANALEIDVDLLID